MNAQKRYHDDAKIKMINDNLTQSYLWNWKDTQISYQLHLWSSNEHLVKIQFIKSIRFLHDAEVWQRFFMLITLCWWYFKSLNRSAKFLARQSVFNNRHQHWCHRWKVHWTLFQKVKKSLEPISNSFKSSQDFCHVIKVIFSIQWNALFYVSLWRKLYFCLKLHEFV